jgi:hypothetical protein
MPKVHELLAVQSNLVGQSTKLRGELINTFEKKRHLFEETRKTFTPLGEEGGVTVEEQKDIQTTVVDEINWICKHLVKSLDVAYQVDLANTLAKADIVTETGEVLVKNVPATALLQLEKRVNEIKELISAIPTLDPTKSFTLDPDHSKSGVFKAREITKIRKQKVKKAFELSKATDKFPANVQMIDEDVPVGKILEQEWSSLITPAIKADLLGQVEILYRAVTSARSKANDYSVEGTQKIGAALLEFVFKPLNVVS